MIDTVVIESPPIGYAMEGFIENFCIKSQAIQLKTGELVYSFTNGSLDGSFDSRISIQVKRERWTIDHNLFVEKGIKTPKKVKCEPYIRVECSVHKAMLGHNVFGGPLDFSTSVKWLINFLNESFKNYAVWSPVLPPWDEWRVFRVDVAEVFNLGSFEAVEEWFRGVNFANFPRRTVNKYAMSGLYASGRTTTVKAYHKGVEFAKHVGDIMMLMCPCSDDKIICQNNGECTNCEVYLKSELRKVVEKSEGFSNCREIL